MASKVTSSRTAAKASRARRGKASMAKATGRPPYSSSGPQTVQLSIPRARPGMAPASATPRASTYKTASKAVVTKTEPAAPEPSRRNDSDYVYICVPRELMAPVDYGLTETVQHKVSQSAGPHNAAPVLHSVPLQLPATASQQSCGDTSTTSYARVLVLQPGGSDDTSFDIVETEPHVEALMQHVAGRLAVPGASGAAEAKVLMDSGSGITAISEELVEALQGQPGMTQTALAQAFVGHARVVTPLGQECDIEAQSCPLHLTIETSWRQVRFTMPFIVLSGGSDVIIVQKPLREKLGIDVMAQLKASVLKAQWRQDGAWMELTACSVGKRNDGDVLRAAMAITAFVPGGDATGDVDDKVPLTLPSQ